MYWEPLATIICVFFIFFLASMGMFDILGIFVHAYMHISVEILDANAEGLTTQETVERLDEMNPLLIAIVVYGQNPSASTQVMPAASEICTSIKEQSSNSKVLLVGGHVAALPERTIQDEDADFVCGGEGLQTLVELIQVLKSNRIVDVNLIDSIFAESK